MRRKASRDGGSTGVGKHRSCWGRAAEALTRRASIVVDPCQIIRLWNDDIGCNSTLATRPPLGRPASSPCSKGGRQNTDDSRHYGAARVGRIDRSKPGSIDFGVV